MQPGIFSRELIFQDSRTHKAAITRLFPHTVSVNAN